MLQSSTLAAEKIAIANPRTGARWLRYMAVVGAVIGFTLFSFFLNTRYNSFPYWYHPDESTKAEQVIDDQRNFNHPLLLLDVSQWLTEKCNVERDTQPVVQVGRYVSAAFSAICVGAIALAGFIEAEWMGLVCLGAFAMCSPMLITCSHYMKEDTALICGMGVFLLGCRLMFVKYTSWIAELLSVVILGAGCALTVSGKYVGAICILPALLILFAGNRWRWLDLILRPIISLGTTALLIWALNLRFFAEWDQAVRSLTHETFHPLNGHLGIIVIHPFWYWIQITVQDCPWWVVALTICAVPVLIFTWRRRSGFDWLVAALLICIFVAMGFSRAYMTRYALPAVVIMHVLAGLVLLWTHDWLQSRTRHADKITAILLTISALVLGLRTLDQMDQLRNDSHVRVRAWLQENTKSGDVVLVEHYTGILDDDGFKPGVTVLPRFFAAERRTLDDLRDEGVTYVALSDNSYGRFLDPRLSGTPDDGGAYQQAHDNYADLFKRGQEVWKSVPSHDLLCHSNPEMHVLRIPSQ